MGTIDISEPQFQGLALSLDGAWITYNSENLVWLPSEYRPPYSAVLGRTIGIGVGSGKVWIRKVELNTCSLTVCVVIIISVSLRDPGTSVNICATNLPQRSFEHLLY
jgi:hypothetical protein